MSNNILEALNIGLSVLAIMGLLDFVTMMFKQVAFLNAISQSGLDIPLNFKECLKSVENVSNFLVPEAIKLLIDKLSISKHDKDALIFFCSIVIVLASHLTLQLLKHILLRMFPQFYFNYIRPIFRRPRASS